MVQSNERAFHYQRRNWGTGEGSLLRAARLRVYEAEGGICPKKYVFGGRGISYLFSKFNFAEIKFFKQFEIFSINRFLVFGGFHFVKSVLSLCLSRYFISKRKWRQAYQIIIKTYKLNTIGLCVATTFRKPNRLDGKRI